MSSRESKRLKTTDSYQETFNTWNKLAGLYQEKFMYLDLYNETYDFLLNSGLKDGAKVLETGCGPGNITKYLLSKRPDLDILGIDIAPNMIELARKNNPTADFREMDVRQVGNLKTKFDGIVCGFCLPYLSQEDSRKLLADCHQILTDKGLLYLSFVDGDPKESAFQSGSSGDRVFFYYHRLEELRVQLIENHFVELKTFMVNYIKSDTQTETHSILIAEKES